MGGASSIPIPEPPVVEFDPFILGPTETCATISLFKELKTPNPNVTSNYYPTSYTPNVSFLASRKNDLIRFNKTYRRVCIRYKNVKLVGWLVPNSIVYDYDTRYDPSPFEATVQILDKNVPTRRIFSLHNIYRIETPEIRAAAAKKAAAEEKRLAEEAEANRVAAEEAEAKRLAEAEAAEAKRLAEEAEANRVAAEEAEKAKAKRVAEEAEAKRVATAAAAAERVAAVQGRANWMNGVTNTTRKPLGTIQGGTRRKHKKRTRKHKKRTRKH